jgi:hypothetical protein
MYIKYFGVITSWNRSHLEDPGADENVKLSASSGSGVWNKYWTKLAQDRDR